MLSQCFVTPRFSAQSRTRSVSPRSIHRLMHDLFQVTSSCTSTRLRPLAGTGGGASEAARSAQVCGRAASMAQKCMQNRVPVFRVRLFLTSMYM